MLRSVIVSGMLTIGLLFIGVRHVHAQLDFGTPEKLGPNINDGGGDEAGPSLSHDGLELFFDSSGLYSATRETAESEFGPRQMIGGGARPSISADGLSLYFRRSNDIWFMARQTLDSDWDPAERLGQPINSTYNESAPSISADGLELYIESNRPDRSKQNSIWVSKRTTVDSPWEEPVKLGPHINATWYDGCPQTSADGYRLFFCAWGGATDMDLWMATRETIDSDWGEPVNLGSGINTAQTEISPHLSADGSEFYFSRGSQLNVGSYDLWWVPVILPPAEDILHAGDADQNRSFDQLDLVQVLQAGKYLSGESATWGEGDWNGAPGGSVGDPPTGDGLFDQLDIIKALTSGLYMTGASAAVRPEVDAGETHASVGNDATIGEIWGDTPDGTELTSASIASAAGGFTLGPAENLGGSFHNGSVPNVFNSTFGNSFGAASFGSVAQPSLEEEFLLSDLMVVGSSAGGEKLGDVDSVYVPVPEPASILLLSLSVLAIMGCVRMPR